MSFSDDAAHAGELLSALADGELEADESARVRDHVAACAVCRHEFDELERARAALRSLPELDPPVDLVERLVRRRQRAFVYGSSLGAAAAMLLVIVALNATVYRHRPVQPELAAFTDQHATAAAAIAEQAPTSRPVLVPNDTVIINAIDGLSLQSVEDRDGSVVQATYRRGQAVVSVFSQPGTVDWDALPRGERFTAGPNEAWRVADGGTVVVDSDGLVFTLVSSDVQLVSDVAANVPDQPSAGWWQRAHDAGMQVIRAFSFG